MATGKKRTFGDWLVSTRAVIEARVQEAREDLLLLEPLLAAMPADRMPAAAPATGKPARRPKPTTDELLAVLGKEPMMLRELAAALDRRPNVIKPTLDALVKSKIIARDPENKKYQRTGRARS